jgi:LemA protein
MKEKQNIRWGLIISLIIIGILLITMLSTVSWVITFNNNVVTAEQDVNTQFSNIKTEYQRRADLYITTATTIKSYAEFEHDTLVDTIKARSQAFTGNQKEDMENMNMLDSLFTKLMVLFEQYPQLKALPLYQDFTSEQKNTENRIQIARSDYNGIVRQYNIYINRFPNVLLKGLFSKENKDFFENKQGSEDIPQLNMSIRN